MKRPISLMTYRNSLNRQTGSMQKKEKALYIKEQLERLYPHTETFLHFNNDYQLLFAIILSAQATDKSVNEATAKLFQLLPHLEDYKEENRLIILDSIKKVGLGKSKCEYILKTAKILLEDYEGKVPTDREKLMSLPGVGYKTSAVFLGEYYNLPFIPVDTHVYRVTHRLGLVKDSLSADETEVALEKLYQGQSCIHLHRQFILLGRNICSAKSPKCTDCPLKEVCSYHQKQKVN